VPEKVLFTWSGGKDSALALHEIQSAGEYDVIALLTTVTGDYGRVSMHGVRVELLEMQAKAIGIPLEQVVISKGADNGEYERAMGSALSRYQAQGVSVVAFGDIFLADLRKYREEKLAAVNMRALFPIWERDTAELARSFIAQGFKAKVSCVDSHFLEGKNFAGRDFDSAFLADLPMGVDPCGENGEFHTFVHGGPVFRKPVRCERGEVVLRENRYWFCDLLPCAAEEG